MSTDVMPEAEAMIVEIEITVPECLDYDERVVERLAECSRFLNSIPDMNTRLELMGTLNHSLEHLGRVCRAGERGQLYTDFAPLSFGWHSGGMVGGLIYHGPHDGFGNGGAPTFSVSLSDEAGWQLHT